MSGMKIGLKEFLLLTCLRYIFICNVLFSEKKVQFLVFPVDMHT